MRLMNQNSPNQRCIIKLGRFMSQIPKSTVINFKMKGLVRISTILSEKSRCRVQKNNSNYLKLSKKLQSKIILTQIEKVQKPLHSNGLASNLLFMVQINPQDSTLIFSNNLQRLLFSSHQILPSIQESRSIILMND